MSTSWVTIIDGHRVGVAPCEGPEDCPCRLFPTELGQHKLFAFDTYDTADEFRTALLTYAVFTLDGNDIEDLDVLAETLDWWADSISVIHAEDVHRIYGEVM
jgi:hypothetical protein